MQGTIFSIQRYCIHDGPGIRTTVFLSGCPLRCRWCSNPESWDVAGRLFFSRARCIGCHECVKAAASDELIKGERGPVILYERCTPEASRKAAGRCPTGALSVKPVNMDARSVVDEIKKDVPFYRQSGGGATFSGGEPLLQAGFLAEALELCRDAGIRTAVETAGCVSWEAFEEVLSLVDLFIFDIKHMDAAVHKEHTGRDNRLILENFVRLAERHKTVMASVPVIPGFNCDKRAIADIISFLDANGVLNRRFLPFHQYARSKYESLGLSYPMKDAAPLCDDDVRGLISK
ncbi:MAG: glycyl-radical enzyme activating protein [Clostridia bacterium]|nr:glycyl-radical enzyme activating protein [Clostridia bacterium]